MCRLYDCLSFKNPPATPCMNSLCDVVLKSWRRHDPPAALTATHMLPVFPYERITVVVDMFSCFCPCLRTFSPSAPTSTPRSLSWTSTVSRGTSRGYSSSLTHLSAVKPTSSARRRLSIETGSTQKMRITAMC